MNALPKEIVLDRSSPALKRWVIETARGNHPSPALIEELLAIVNSEHSTTFAKSIAAYLLGTFKVERALPAFEQHFGEQWAGVSEKEVEYRSSPETAMLDIGAASLPALERILSKTDRADMVFRIAIMIFNVTGSKAEAKRALESAAAARSPEERGLFTDTLKAIETWKE